MGEENETSRFFRILEIIKTEFTPRESYVREGVPTFVVPFDTQTMAKIDRLALQLSSENLGLIVGRGVSEVTLQVVPKRIEARPSFSFMGLNLSFVLFIATIVTVTISGYYVSSDFVRVLSMLNFISPSNVSFAIWSQTALYAVTIMSAVGLHEIGHFIAARRHGVKASLPLFIPGIPGLFPGTFGAFIRQERPASNRNELFDIGIAGPAVGFLISMVASILGYSMSLGLTYQEYIAIFGPGNGAGLIYPPLIFLLTGRWIFPNPNAYTHVLHPLALAGWAGTLITFLNAFPIGQLDGGHVSRALLGRTWHRRLGYAMIILMLLSGWWTMALLVMFLIRTGHPGTIDDVTNLTPKRKLMGLAFVAMFIAVFTLSPDSLLLMLIFG